METFISFWTSWWWWWWYIRFIFEKVERPQHFNMWKIKTRKRNCCLMTMMWLYLVYNSCTTSAFSFSLDYATALKIILLSLLPVMTCKHNKNKN